jgi:hypothetical protein
VRCQRTSRSVNEFVDGAEETGRAARLLTEARVLAHVATDRPLMFILGDDFGSASSTACTLAETGGRTLDGSYERTLTGKMEASSDAGEDRS